MKARLLLVLFGLIGVLPIHAAHTQVKVLLSQTMARPGETVQGALELRMDPGWHTYWRNPGDAGFPPSVEWELPAGITVSPFSWPAPQKKVLTKMSSYVYDGVVHLPFTVTLAPDAQDGAVSLKGPVNWLECTDATCVPADSEVSVSLKIGNTSQKSGDAETIARALEKIPKANDALKATASWEGAAAGKTRQLLIEWTPVGKPEKPDFYPYESENYSIEGDTQIVGVGERVQLRKVISIDGAEWPQTIQGLVLERTGKEQSQVFEVTLSPGGGASASPVAGATSAGPTATTPASGGVIEIQGEKQAPPSLIVVLALAFVGGMILNFMPCVLPVIALKILGFVNQGGENPTRVRRLGIMYALGVIASFLILAGMIIAVKSQGNEAVWGMQMQNPYFVLGLTVLMTLIALNLFGVFEITVSGKVMQGASALGSREGGSGAFYNGVVATLLATPCTAPFLGVAVGTALAQPSYVIILTFLSVALGLAFPYVLLCWNPGWLKFLPKPGAWMESFKKAMGFPMLATAVWLLSISTTHFGKGSLLWLGIFLVMIAIAAWVWGEFVQRGTRRTGLAMAVAAAFLLTGYFWPLEAKLHWRQVASGEREVTPAGIAVEPGGIAWQPWSPEAVIKAQTEGRPVFVDFTADWCLTCQLNKETSIEIESVRQKLKETGTVPLLADFTSRNKRIAQELKRFNRAGVPLVVVFPADTNAPPIVLPELLTPSQVLEGIELAARPTAVRKVTLK